MPLLTSNVMFKKIITSALILIFAPLAIAEEALTNNRILKFAMEPYAKSAKMNTTEILGTHNKNILQVIYPCGDICPDYTKRIIHYKIEMKNCKNIGGIIKKKRIVRGRASNIESFCVPVVIADNWEKLVF